MSGLNKSGSVDSDEARQEYYGDLASDYEASRYGEPRRQIYREKVDALILNTVQSSFPANSACRILDLATGTGRIAQMLGGQGYTLVGVDLTFDMLKRAKERARRENTNIAYIQANAKCLPFRDGAFDATVSIKFTHMLDKAEWIQIRNELARVVKSSGICMVEVVNTLRLDRLFHLKQLYNWLFSGGGDHFGLWPWEFGSAFGRFDVVRLIGLQKFSDRLFRLFNHFPLNYIATHMLVVAKKSL